MKTAIFYSDFDVQKTVLNAKFARDTQRKPIRTPGTRILALSKFNYSISILSSVEIYQVAQASVNRKRSCKSESTNFMAHQFN
jgi:hypothetical protein